MQTIYTSLVTPSHAVVYRRERCVTPDGDFIDFDWSDGPENTPLVVLFHGLEGSSRSHYALCIMAALRQLGWRGVVAHFRGCSGEPNLLPRAYHSGDADEIDWILQRLRAFTLNHPLFAIGVSLGGNALLKWLGQRRSTAVVNAAIAVSAPVDLHVGGRQLEHGFNKIYTRYFLHSLKRKSVLKLAQYPGLFNRAAMLRSKTLYEFDNVVTAPLHGFRDTDDYWTQASSKGDLAHISVPTLMISARNDPFYSAAALPLPSEVAPCLSLDFPGEGGHVGFIESPFPGRFSYLPRRIVEFMSRHCERGIS